MARYALVAGIVYKNMTLMKDFAFDNAPRIHNFLLHSGYDSVSLSGFQANCNGIIRQIEIISKKLKSGDTFVFYFSGYGYQTNTGECRLSHDAQTRTIENEEANSISIKFIELATNIAGVQRILLLNTFKKTVRKNPDSSGEIDVISDEGIDVVVQHAPRNSPIAIFSSFDNRYLPSELEELGGSVFSKALLHAFNMKAQNGLEISFPEICEPIHNEMSNLMDTHFPKTQTYAPHFSGSAIIIHPKGNPISDLPFKLSDAQVAAKQKADDLLDKLLKKHMEWLRTKSDEKEHRLTWGKLKPVFDIYKSSKLGQPNLRRRDMSFANFSDVNPPHNISFKGAILRNASFYRSTLIDIDFSECRLTDTNFSQSDIFHCNFSGTFFWSADFSISKIRNSNFDFSHLSRSNLFKSQISGSSFHNTNLNSSNLSDAVAVDAIFTKADLSRCSLVNADFSGSTLTGVKLYGTARSDWKIEDVDCRYVYWDKKGEDRFPPKNDFESGEFTIENRDYVRFSYTFTDGFTPFDLMLANSIVDQINQADMGFEVMIKNAEVHGLNPTVNFIMVTGDDKKEEASALFSERYEQKIGELQSELSRVNQLLLDERGHRVDFAEKHLDIQAEQQQLMAQYVMPLVADLLNRKTPSHQNKMDAAEEIKQLPSDPSASLPVTLCDKNLSVQVAENVPVIFGSLKHYAAFKATLELSDPKKHSGPCNLAEIAKYAGEIEIRLSKGKVEWPINSSEEISKICCSLRNYCHENARLDFLQPLVLQQRKKTVSLLGYAINPPSDHLPQGRPISAY